MTFDWEYKTSKTYLNASSHTFLKTLLYTLTPSWTFFFALIYTQSIGTSYHQHHLAKLSRLYSREIDVLHSIRVRVNKPS